MALIVLYLCIAAVFFTCLAAFQVRCGSGCQSTDDIVASSLVGGVFWPLICLWCVAYVVTRLMEETIGT